MLPALYQIFYYVKFTEIFLLPHYHFHKAFDSFDDFLMGHQVVQRLGSVPSNSIDSSSSCLVLLLLNPGQLIGWGEEH